MKPKTHLLPYLLAFFAILIFTINSCESPLFAAEDIMDVNEIKLGMKGYGKTVFLGDRIDIFDVEVLGILRNWDTKSDMVLIKMSGGPLEKTGIIAGMSGSPVYINNRLIGAVAYGWSFAKEAIAGVTPIKEMKDTLLDLPVQDEKDTFASAGWELQPFKDDGMVVGKKDNSLQYQETLQTNSGYPQLTPILTPLIITGIDNGIIQQMRPFFNKYGLYPVQGGSYIPSAGITEKGKLVPGAAVAVILIKGDLNAAVVGTVTYVDVDNVLAFGHSFLQTGNTDMPMATAYVYTVLSSQSSSVKMASPIELAGRISQDRKSGIAGILGEFPRMVPCHIEVEGSQQLKYDFEIIDNKLLTPSLVLMAAQSAVLSTEKRLGEKSVNVKLSCQIDKYENPVVIENVFYEFDQSLFSLNHIMQPFAMLTNNQFQKVCINKIDLKIKVLDFRRTAYIEAVKVDKKQIKPGDVLQVDVRLKPFTGESFSQTASIQIPEDTLPGSTLNVTACDATYGQALNMGRSAGKYLPTNFEQLINYVENIERNNNLMIRVLLPKRGITFKGEGFPSLPSSVLAIMSFSSQSGVGHLFDEVITRIPTQYVLNGNQSIPVLVK